jgi:histidinol-phosphate aminotransferase
MLRTESGYSRRSFARIASVFAAGAALPYGSEFALAQLSMVSNVPGDAVRINANENPLGPCAEAAEAITSVVRNGGRYMYDESNKLATLLAEVEGIPPSHVMAFAGSSDPLFRAVVAFGSPSRSVVTGDPGFEAPLGTASMIGAQTFKVPLTEVYAHDVRAMAKADASAGLFYICNPNNPTGTLTPREDIEWLLGNKPEGSVVLLDEAYIHISKNAVPCSDLVAAGKDLVILRTFSKLYGMAGLRAGAALARPDLLSRLARQGANIMPVTGMIGAQASLRAKDLVTERRKLIGDVRDDTLEFLAKHNFSFVPSESNKFMVDVKRPGGEVVRAMAAEKVYIGRVWSAMPTHVRVSVGTREEMAKFKEAFLKIMG